MVEAVVQYDYAAREPDELTIRKGDVITGIRMQDGGWWEGSLNGKRGMFPDNFVKVSETTETNGTQNEVNLRTSSGRRCKVLYSYQPNNDDELQLQVNDIIEVLAEVEDGWWKGSLRNKVGVFPSNFVKEIVEKTTPEQKNTASRKTSQTQPPLLTQLLKDEEKPSTDADMATDSPASPTGPNSGNPAADHIMDAPTLPPKPGAMKEQCRALFPYKAHNDDELTLEEGDIITILSKEVQDEGWWKGVLRGKVGVFPDNFVEELPPVPVEEPQQRKPERPPAKIVPAIPSNKNVAKPTSKAGNLTGSTGSLTKKPADTNSKSSAKSEDKVPTASVLPSLNKKPMFPPTAKKPQLRPVSGSGLSHPVDAHPHPHPHQREPHPHQLPRERHGDAVDGGAASRVAPPHENGKTNEDDMDFDGVERGAMLTHPTARRARAPGRRPPSSIFNKDAEPWSGLVNGNSEHENHSAPGDHHNDANEAKEAANAAGNPPSTVIAAARSKEWEKQKAPWMEELKQNQAKKNTRTSPIPSPTTKPEINRKSADGDSWSNPSTPDAAKSSSLSRPQSAVVSSTNNGNGIGAASPKSLGHAEAPGRSPRTSTNSYMSPSSADNSASATPVSASDDKGSVSVKQFHDVLDRVSKLENLCDVLTNQVATLSLQLKDEYEKRCYFQQELEKLHELVTSV